jgi:hypothetical protein
MTPILSGSKPAFIEMCGVDETDLHPPPTSLKLLTTAILMGILPKDGSDRGTLQQQFNSLVAHSKLCPLPYPKIQFLPMV